MSNYIISPQALQDLREITAFKEQYSNQSALQWNDKISQKIQTLAKFPNLGRSREELARGLRSFPVEDYLILYRIVNQRIEIARIVSGYRDLETLFENTDELV